IIRTLNKKREDRPPSARALRDELLAMVPNSSGAPRPSLPAELVDTKFGPTRLRTVGRSRSPALWAAALALIFAGGGYAAYRLGLPGTAGPSNPTTTKGPTPATTPESANTPAPASVAADAVSANREGNQLYQKALAEEDPTKRADYLREAIKAYY